MVEIIGAGLGRTGTYSLQAALTRLGYGPCHHMSSLGEDPRLLAEWTAVARGQAPDWRRLLTGFRSAVDWPAAAFWRQLLETYPEAKVVLTVRDPRSWYASAHRTIYRYTALQPGLGGALTWLEDRLSVSIRRRREICRRLIWDGVFDGRFQDPRYAMEIFQRHNEEVRAWVPGHRLLVFEVSQGWRPLCDFLGADVPDEPFPHLNDAAEFRRLAALRQWRTLTLRKTVAVGGAAIR
ncbi:sulfotransferase family protein [Streptosporangium sp. NPDC051022]|uniref:sulfotransferase family protein n=1 Tax=Streptosporangium sp. NPDC051022 TaxID=3155752 RepID=UPI00341E33FF